MNPFNGEIPEIPVPFVVALLLVILFFKMLQNPANRHITSPAAFVGIAAILISIAGLRWAYDLEIARRLQPPVAALLPATAWISFPNNAHKNRKRLWWHFVPAGLLFLATLGLPTFIDLPDIVLTLLYVSYGTMLIVQASGGEDVLESARLTDARKALRAVRFVGLYLILSVLLDLLIAFDFAVHEGVHARTIVGLFNLVTLPLAAYAIAVIGDSIPTNEDEGKIETPAPAPTDDENRIMAEFDSMMRDRKLYKDANLTLERIARRLAIPSRQVSGAINRSTGGNVSQAVNAYRIEEAGRLLHETDMPITSVMFECGFQTKSNFNREFVRIKGQSPSDYRRSGAS